MEHRFFRNTRARTQLSKTKPARLLAGLQNVVVRATAAAGTAGTQWPKTIWAITPVATATSR